MKSKILFIAACFLFASGCASKGAETVKYDNGLTAVFLYNQESLAASVNVFVRAGAIDEKPSQAGLSHFLEHLMFKGSKNYPGDALSRNTENLGGYINAMTSKDFTRYYINIQKDGVPETIKMLADAMQNPLFPQEEIDKESKVVIEEIKIHLDNPVSVLYDKFCDMIYEKSAMKNSVIGRAEVIANVSRDEIYEYYSSHYVPEKMLVIIAGNFDVKKAQKLVAQTFGKFEKKAPPAEPNLIEPVHPSKNYVKKSDVEVSYMVNAFLGPDDSSDDMFAGDIASIILGGSKSSRLNMVLKEEKQLVYSIGSASVSSKGTGVFYIYSVFDAKNMDAIKTEVRKQIEKIIADGVTDEELNRAKIAVKTGWSFSQEKPSDIAHERGYWAVIGKPDYPDVYLSKIESVTSDDVKNFFTKYYLPDAVTNTALIPEKTK
ncbi:M16 family metallopeptidase [Endomicrobium proavitum]|nr:pitrilysin family protein [Endomicrobium proavitum]